MIRRFAACATIATLAASAGLSVETSDAARWPARCGQADTFRQLARCTNRHLNDLNRKTRRLENDIAFVDRAAVDYDIFLWELHDCTSDLLIEATGVRGLTSYGYYDAYPEGENFVDCRIGWFFWWDPAARLAGMTFGPDRETLR